MAPDGAVEFIGVDEVGMRRVEGRRGEWREERGGWEGGGRRVEGEDEWRVNEEGGGGGGKEGGGGRGSGVARNIELVGHCLCTLPKALHRGAEY